MLNPEFDNDDDPEVDDDVDEDVDAGEGNVDVDGARDTSTGCGVVDAEAALCASGDEPLGRSPPFVVVICEVATFESVGVGGEEDGVITGGLEAGDSLTWVWLSLGSGLLIILLVWRVSRFGRGGMTGGFNPEASGTFASRRTEAASRPGGKGGAALRAWIKGQASFNPYSQHNQGIRRYVGYH
jgi:hypothetical protein